MTNALPIQCLLALVLLGSVVAPVAATPPTPVGPSGPSAPTPTPPTATPAPNGSPLGPTVPTANGSGANGSGGGVFAGVGDRVKQGIIDALREVGINQSMLAVGQLRNTSVALVGYNPHANNAGQWYHNPTNGIWDENWDTYRTTGRYLWAGAVLIGGALGLIFKSTGIMNPAQSRQWFRRWVVGIVAGGTAWEWGNAYLHLLDGTKSMLLTHATADGGAMAITAVGAVVLIVGIALTTSMLWALGLVVLIVAMSIVGIDLLTPYLGALIAARGIPIEMANGPADAATKMWGVLPALTLPMALFLTAGFSSLAEGLADATAFGVLTLVIVQVGAFVLAVFSPYIVWTKASSTTMLSVGFAGGSFAANQRYQQAKNAAGKAKQGAQGARDATRGARGKAPIGDGGRGYDAGQAVRQTGSALRPSGPGSTAQSRERTKRMLRRGGSSNHDSGLADTVAQNDRTRTLNDLINDNE